MEKQVCTDCDKEAVIEIGRHENTLVACCLGCAETRQIEALAEMEAGRNIPGFTFKSGEVIGLNGSPVGHVRDSEVSYASGGPWYDFKLSFRGRIYEGSAKVDSVYVLRPMTA